MLSSQARQVWRRWRVSTGLNQAKVPPSFPNRFGFSALVNRKVRLTDHRTFSSACLQARNCSSQQMLFVDGPTKRSQKACNDSSSTNWGKCSILTLFVHKVAANATNSLKLRAPDLLSSNSANLAAACSADKPRLSCWLACTNSSTERLWSPEESKLSNTSKTRWKCTTAGSNAASCSLPTAPSPPTALTACPRAGLRLRTGYRSDCRQNKGKLSLVKLSPDELALVHPKGSVLRRSYHVVMKLSHANAPVC